MIVKFNLPVMKNKANKRNILKLLIISVFIIGISSCRSYKDLGTAPSADSEGIIRDYTNNSDSSNVAEIPWTEYFSDPSLQKLISEGLENNSDLQLAVSKIVQAEANLKIARGSLLPQISAGLQVDQIRISNGENGKDVLGYTSSSSANTLGFSASWEIDLWGKLAAKSKGKFAGYLNSVEYKNLVQTELVANIANAYYNLLCLDKQLQVTNETIALLKESAESIGALKEAGKQNASAVEQSYALLYSTQLSVPLLESQIREQENTICLLLNRKPGAIIRSSIDEQIVSANLKIGVPAQLLAQRPDVKRAELDVLAAYANTYVAKMDFYPSLTLNSASLGLADGDFSNFFKPENLVAEIAAGLTQPVFMRHQLKSNLKIANAQQNECLITFSKTVLSAGKEVSDILFGYESSLRKNDLRKLQVTSLSNAVDYSQALLISGEALYTEVLSAQRDLLSAQLNQVSDKLEQLIYSVNLYKALGGGIN